VERVRREERTDPIDHEPCGIKLRSQKIRIEVMKGADAGKMAELPGLQVLIGSGRDCDFVLNDRTVSHHHLTLKIDKGHLRVTDQGSRNGTLLDGMAVLDALARPDSVLVMGGTTLRLRMLADVVELPLSQKEEFGGLLGRSIAMRRVFSLLERVAARDCTLLIEGETGTGKELAAAGIHAASARAGKPFVIFDCSAAAPTLIESALFGQMKGAFTGAIADRPGVFEQADGGTLFLDELGELPLELQPKLLRALEAREIRRLGDTTVRRFDVRIVAATNRSLAREVDRGRFREDLYYRLAVVTVHLPPLRERPEDIPLLVRHLEKELAQSYRPPPRPISESTMNTLCAQAWPGNVRELRNAVDRALAFGEPEEKDLAPPPTPSASEALAVNLDEPLIQGRSRIVEAYNREYISMILVKTKGNISRAAKLAGVGRNYLHRAIKRYGLGRTPAENEHPL
jgi:DNA-binding NtrC family response regulator